MVKVLIVAECNVNCQFCCYVTLLFTVLIVAECNVNMLKTFSGFS